MDLIISQVIQEMIAINSGDSKRIEHTIKVHNYARQIGILEQISPKELQLLELTAVLHDIGIQISLIKYGSSAAKYQEIEGPAIVREILSKHSISEKDIDKIAFIVGNHHTYSAVDDLTFQVLVEADFIVNAVEDNLSPTQIKTISKNIFKTSTGISMLNSIFTENL